MTALPPGWGPDPDQWDKGRKVIGWVFLTTLLIVVIGVAIYLVAK